MINVVPAGLAATTLGISAPGRMPTPVGDEDDVPMPARVMTVGEFPALLVIKVSSVAGRGDVAWVVRPAQLKRLALDRSTGSKMSPMNSFSAFRDWLRIEKTAAHSKDWGRS